MNAYYPVRAASVPLIVFSHGLGGAGRGTRLPRFWAGCGYVCLVPVHTDSLAPDVAGERSAANAERFLALLQRAARDPSFCRDRVQDVKFLLDSLPHLLSAGVPLGNRLPIGLAGFSLGAFVAQLMGGAFPGAAVTVRATDERISALMLLGSQGVGRFGLTGNSWCEFQKPAFSVAGTERREEWRMDPFRRSPPGHKYHLWLQGARHLTVGGILRQAGALPRRPSGPAKEQVLLLGALQDATAAFWDAYLKASPARLQQLVAAWPEAGAKSVGELYVR